MIDFLRHWMLVLWRDPKPQNPDELDCKLIFIKTLGWIIPSKTNLYYRTLLKILQMSIWAHQTTTTTILRFSDYLISLNPRFKAATQFYLYEVRIRGWISLMSTSTHMLIIAYMTPMCVTTSMNTRFGIKKVKYWDQNLVIVIIACPYHEIP